MENFFAHDTDYKYLTQELENTEYGLRIHEKSIQQIKDRLAPYRELGERLETDEPSKMLAGCRQRLESVKVLIKEQERKKENAARELDIAQRHMSEVSDELKVLCSEEAALKRVVQHLKDIGA